MKLRILLAIIVASTFILGYGCTGGGDEKVLARINKNQTITLKDLNDRISKLPKRYQDIINKNKKAFLDEVIVDTLLYNEALKRKLDRDKEVKKLIKEARRKILIVRLLKDEIEEGTEVSEKEIEDYYNANKEQFTTPEVLRASHILVKTEGEAKDILVELSNGRNFEDLARARSVDPTSSIGGDIGYFTKGQLVPEFEEACFSMKVGEISDIVKTKFGYHIIKLTERKKPQLKKLKDIRGTIEQSLKRRKKKLRFNEFVDNLREKAQISINDGLLEDLSKKEKQDKTQGKTQKD